MPISWCSGGFLSQWDTRGFLISGSRSPVEALHGQERSSALRAHDTACRSPRTTHHNGFTQWSSLATTNESSRDPSLDPNPWGSAWLLFLTSLPLHSQLPGGRVVSSQEAAIRVVGRFRSSARARVSVKGTPALVPLPEPPNPDFGKYSTSYLYGTTGQWGWG